TDYRPDSYVKGCPVGDVEIGGSIVEVIDEIFGAIPHTEFSAELRSSIERGWSEGTGFGTAFIKNLANILGKFGLIFVDPMHPALKSLSAPIYAEAAEKSDEIVASIRRRD